MGTILFLIYLAGVVGILKLVLGFAGGTILFVVLIFFLATEGCEPNEGFYVTLGAWARRGAALVVLGVILPTGNFLYMAAGIKAGEEVVQSETGQKAFMLLNKELDELLEEYGVEIEND